MAVAQIDVSIEWKKISSDSYSASISPKGTVEYPLYSMPDRKVYCSFAAGCRSYWYLIINGRMFPCQKYVDSARFTLLNDHSVKVNRALMVPCTFFNEYKFKGDEIICLVLVGEGAWRGEITPGEIDSFAYYVAGRGCQNIQSGENGGDVPPPVKPATCVLNGDVAINHGEINLKQLNGREATTTARLSCSREVTAEVSVSNTGVINLNDSGSLRSTIYISGVKGKNTFRNVINADVVFKSVISFDGGYVSGYFSRSAVVTVSII